LWPSAQRYSIVTLRPSTKPVSFRPRRKARRRLANRSGVSPPRNPITGIASCCARAASGHAAALPSMAMNSRRFSRWNRMRSPPDCAGLQHIDLASVSQRVRQPFCNRAAGCTAHPRSAPGHSRRVEPRPDVQPCPQHPQYRPQIPCVGACGEVPEGAITSCRATRDTSRGLNPRGDARM
jgi:hypothetical protein